LTGCGAEKLRVVLNRSHRSDEITDQEIEKTLRHPVYCQLPNDYQTCIQAINSGRPLVTSNHSELARSYKDLARRLSGLAPPEKRGGLLRLFRRGRGKMPEANKYRGSAWPPSKVLEETTSRAEPTQRKTARGR
jgi:Flp pilus assembly CpaE family ATPase